jgi:mono/diheme cytochrome c family protein
MAAQPKGKAQMTYGRTFGEEDLVTRDPVEGTMPRDYYPYPFSHLGNEIKDAEAVGKLLKNPVSMTKESLERGENRFNIYCIACHGRKGNGDGSATGANRFPAPPSLHTDQARKYEDGTIYHILMKGTGQMPSYADKLSEEDRWNTIHYVRALQRAMNPKPEDLEQ